MIECVEGLECKRRFNSGALRQVLSDTGKGGLWSVKDA